MNNVEEMLLMPAWALDELRRLEEDLFERISVEHYEVMEALEEAYPDFPEFVDAFSSLSYTLFALN